MAALNGVAAEWSAREYGGRFDATDTPAQVGTSSAVLVKNNPERVNLLVINLSVNTVYLRPNNPATTAAAIILAPNGGSFSTNLLEDLVLPSYQYHAVASGAASDVLVIEVARYAKLDGAGGNNEP